MSEPIENKPVTIPASAWIVPSEEDFEKLKTPDGRYVMHVEIPVKNPSEMIHFTSEDRK